MNLREKLNHKGLRLTRPRRIVLSILEDANVPLSPQIIHQRSQDADEEIGLVSVYRTLDLLTELGFVRRVHGNGGCQGYVCASPGHTHHLICQKCEKVIEFSGTGDLEALIRKIEKQTGFKVHGHLLQLHGLCPNCQKEYCLEK